MKKAKEKKSTTVKFRLTERQKKDLVNKLQKLGISISDYFRDRICSDLNVQTN